MSAAPAYPLTPDVLPSSSPTSASAAAAPALQLVPPRVETTARREVISELSDYLVSHVREWESPLTGLLVSVTPGSGTKDTYLGGFENVAAGYIEQALAIQPLKSQVRPSAKEIGFAVNQALPRVWNLPGIDGIRLTYI